VYDVNGSFPRKVTHRYIWAVLFSVVEPFFSSGMIRVLIYERYGVDVKSQVIGKTLGVLCQTKYLRRVPVFPSSHHFKYCFTQKFMRVRNMWGGVTC